MELTNPVIRRRPDDPLFYLMVRQEDGWSKGGMAFPSVEHLERCGFEVGPWQTDEHGEFAVLTRPGDLDDA